MTIRTNEKMKCILGGDEENLNCYDVHLPQGLIDELKSIEFIETGDLVLVEGNYGFVAEHVPDPTGIECLANHWHIDDLIPTSEYSESHMAKLGIGFARELQHKLLATSFRGEFRAIVSVADLLDDSLQRGCTVRCHKLRPGNPWLHEDLEGYRSEALLVIDWTI